jgi:hypothetical protein
MKNPKKAGWLVMICVALIFVAFWLDGNPDKPIVKDYGLKAIATPIFYFSVIIIGGFVLYGVCKVLKEYFEEEKKKMEHDQK